MAISHHPFLMYFGERATTRITLRGAGRALRYYMPSQGRLRELRSGGVVEHRAARLLRALISQFQLPLQIIVEVVDLAVTILRTLQPPAELMDFHVRCALLPTQRVALTARLIQQEADALQRIGHSSDADDDATCTLNVNDGVVPEIVHAARTNGANPPGSGRVSLLIPVFTPNVSRVVHDDPSGESCTVTVNCGVVPDVAVTSSFTTAEPALRDQPVTAEPLPVVVRAADAARYACAAAG